MAEMSPGMVRRMGLPLMIGLALFMVAADFVSLVVTYLMLASVAPNMIGEVAVSPARFAAWITLVKLPMMLAHLLAVSWRSWVAMLTSGEVPDSRVQKGWRLALATVRVWVVDAALSVTAALIVFDQVADPGNAHVWQLVVVTAVGPLLLPRVVSGVVRLLPWWWRRKRTRRTAREAR